MLLGLFWGPVAGARPSATVPRSEEALCDDTPAQVNGGSVRDGTCAPRIWNMGASLTLALELLDPLKHPVHGNIELGVLSCCCTVFTYVLPFSPFYLCAYGSRNSAS